MAIYVRIIYRAVKYLITCLRTFSIDPIQCLLYNDKLTQWLVGIPNVKINVPIEYLEALRELLINIILDQSFCIEFSNKQALIILEICLSNLGQSS